MLGRCGRVPCLFPHIPSEQDLTEHPPHNGEAFSTAELVEKFPGLGQPRDSLFDLPACECDLCDVPLRCGDAVEVAEPLVDRQLSWRRPCLGLGVASSRKHGNGRAAEKGFSFATAQGLS